MYCIENNFLKIEVAQKGAELTSLFNKKTNTELLWQGNPEFWTGQAPILFPIVGELKDGFHIVENKKYEMPRHGIVRKSSDWKIEKVNDGTIVCKFTSNQETLKQFPFQFEFNVRYHLNKNSLEVIQYITNTDSKRIPVSIGAHPAFNCPLSNNTQLTDYYLKFENQESAKNHLLNNKGILKNETKVCLENTDTLALNDEIFNDDALIFKDLKSKKVSLFGPNGEILSVAFKDFPFLGIWSKPKAPYVCIEPWIGHADTIDSTHNLFDKEGSLTLKPNQEYRVIYSITAAS